VRLVSSAAVAALAAALGVWDGLPALIAVAVAGALIGLGIATAGRQRCAGLVAQLKGAAA
jgi:hypothetical protein